MSINDRKKSSLATITADSVGAINDLEVTWLKQMFATGGSLNDLWEDFLRDRNYTEGTIQDRLYEYMTDQGVVGDSYQDKLYNFWDTSNPALYQSNFDFTNGGNPLTALPAILQALNATYTRNSVKNVVQNGALVALTANQFGTEYDPVTGLYGYLPEPAATNLATNSDGNAATYPVKLGVSDGTAVPGFTNGIAFGDNSTQRYAYKQVVVATGTTYNVSIFIIMDDGGAPVVGETGSDGDFNITVDSGVAGTVKLTRLIGSNVYRISASKGGTTGTRNFGIVKQTAHSARTFRVSGIQVETGLRATSYIATAGSTVARAADVLTVPLANITGYNSAGYTLAVDQRMDTTLATSVIAVEVHDLTSSNRAILAALSGVTAFGQSVATAGNAGSATAGAIDLSRARYAASFYLNNLMVAKSGVAGTPDTIVTMPISPTMLSFSAYNGTLQYNSFIFNAKLIPTPLTQAQLNGLTT